MHTRVNRIVIVLNRLKHTAFSSVVGRPKTKSRIVSKKGCAAFAVSLKFLEAYTSEICFWNA